MQVVTEFPRRTNHPSCRAAAQGGRPHLFQRQRIYSDEDVFSIPRDFM
jgi:hypothetical protein